MAEVKAGDQVWYAAEQCSLLVAAVDLEAKELNATAHGVEHWIPIDAVIVQKSCTVEEHRGALTLAARDQGRRGEVARYALAHLWSDGKLVTS